MHFQADIKGPGAHPLFRHSMHRVEPGRLCILASGEDVKRTLKRDERSEEKNESVSEEKSRGMQGD